MILIKKHKDELRKLQIQSDKEVKGLEHKKKAISEAHDEISEELESERASFEELSAETRRLEEAKEALEKQINADSADKTESIEMKKKVERELEKARSLYEEAKKE